MKKIILLLPFLLLISCSIQKRKYQKGFYVNWHKNNTQKEKNNDVATTHYKKVVTEPASQLPEAVIVTQPATEVVASGDNTMNKSSVLKRRPLSLQLNPDSCDEIIFRSGEETRVKIMEISATELKYKRCDNVTGPLYVCKKSDVFMVKYTNGTSETFKAELPNNDASSYNNKSRTRSKRVQHPLAIMAMIFGILSLVSGYLALVLAASSATGGYVFFIPLLVGLVAVFTGKTALNDMKQQPDMYKGKGKAMAGFIEGLIIASIAALILLLILTL